jgi:large subunit ribosomal protein L9
MLEFHVKSGKEGRVFGSVSTKQITEELAKRGYKIDKRKILDTAPIGSLGVTKVRVELYKGVIGTVRVNVKGSE